MSQTDIKIGIINQTDFLLRLFHPSIRKSIDFFGLDC